jgi:hypothetical protein
VDKVFPRCERCAEPAQFYDRVGSGTSLVYLYWCSDHHKGESEPLMAAETQAWRVPYVAKVNSGMMTQEAPCRAAHPSSTEVSMNVGKEIVDEFGSKTGVVVERSDVLIELINLRLKKIEDEANERLWATENHYEMMRSDPSY